MKFAPAFDIAFELVEQMKPFCERVEIAGSLRRGCSEVKDIEIVAQPRFETRTFTVGLFGEEDASYVNTFYEWGQCAKENGLVQWIKPATSEIVEWPLKPDGKYWRGLLPQGIKLDLFLAERNNYGAILLVRTGSREFSRAIAARAQDMGRPLDKGYFHHGDAKAATREERDVFRLLNLGYIEPQYRRTRDDVVPIPVKRREGT